MATLAGLYDDLETILQTHVPSAQAVYRELTDFSPITDKSVIINMRFVRPEFDRIVTGQQQNGSAKYEPNPVFALFCCAKRLIGGNKPSSAETNDTVTRAIALVEAVDSAIATYKSSDAIANVYAAAAGVETRWTKDGWYIVPLVIQTLVSKTR